MKIMKINYLKNKLYDIKIGDKNFNDCVNYSYITYFKNKFYPICLNCEKKVKLNRESEEYYIFQSESNSLRYSMCQILIEGLKKNYGINNNINLLNLGGVQLGSQDLCLKSVNKDIRWFTNEHPKTKLYYDNTYLKFEFKKMEIQVIFNDLGFEKSSISLNFFDIILFTEIIEHLPINVLGLSLKHICDAIKKNCFLIISSPNLVSFEHRMNFLFGTDCMYWGKIKKDIDSGVFGHIDFWHYKTLEKLINDYSFKTIAIYGYNNHSYPKEIRTKILLSVSNIISYINGNFSNTILYVFQKK
jgi:hypothetical protein